MDRPADSTALLFRPALGVSGDDECVERLTAADPADENALVVTYRDSPAEFLSNWDDRIDERPAELGIIAVHETDVAFDSTDEDANVVSVTHPASLGRLETAIYLYVEQWRGNDNRTVVCLDSLTAILQHVDRPTAFRFLHTLTDYLSSRDVTMHVHADPDSHDEETLAAFRSLFDETVGGEHPSSDVDALSPDVLATVLDSPRRRLVLKCLADADAPVTFEEMAERIAVWESQTGKPDADARERVEITLQHVHLPKLVEVGAVEVDGTVASTASPETLQSYVDLTDNASTTGPPPAMGPDSMTSGQDGREPGEETFWTVYGTAPDSVVVTLARALASVEDVEPTELRPVLYDVVDVDALQQLATQSDTSIHATFRYGEHDVVVEEGEIRIYEGSR